MTGRLSPFAKKSVPNLLTEAGSNDIITLASGTNVSDAINVHLYGLLAQAVRAQS
jgi:hypothetical protein